MIPALQAQHAGHAMRQCLHARPALLAGAVLALISPMSSAQTSNVQLFGTVATSATHLSHQATGASSLLMTGPWTAPTFGMRGTEDLGDGLVASFRLESGVDLPSGAAGKTQQNRATSYVESKFMDKAAWLSLGNKTYGLTLGRQIHAGIDRIAETLDIFNANADGKLILSILALNGTNTFGGFDTRADSAIKLRGKFDGGLTVGLSHAYGQTGKFGNSHSADVGVQNATWGAGAYLLHYKGDGVQAGLTQKTWGLGGNYKLGPARLFAHYMDATHDKAADGSKQQNDKVWGLGVSAAVLDVVTLKAALYQDRGSSVGGVKGKDGKRNTVAILGDYALSKRTSLNAGLFRNSVSGAFSSDATSLAVLGLLNPATGAVSGSSMTGVTVGLTHRF